MVAARRFGPLMVLACACFVVLVTRAFHVQVVEHDVWAVEAANLGRSWTIEPYVRGAIFDRAHRPIARDEEAYELELVWRDFRRGHPLGQVAEARSLSSLRPVPLAETLARLTEWALELVRLSPHEIDEFGRGAAIRSGSLAAPAAADPRAEQRWARRGHLHFYVRALLGVDRRLARALRDAKESPAWQRPYLDLVADASERTRESLERELAARLDGSVADLARLASRFTRDDDSGATLTVGELVARLEEARRDVDDAAADDLFESATGFEPWRLDRANLARLDLAWLENCLFWDAGRLAEWVDERGGEFEVLVQRHFAGLALSRSKMGAAQPETRVLDALASLFCAEDGGRGVLAAEPSSWREANDLAVLDQLPDLLEGVDLPGPRAHGAVLPVQSEALRASDRSGMALVDLVLQSVRDPREFHLYALHEKHGVMRAAVILYEAACKEHSPTWTAAEADAAAAVLRAWNARLQGTIAAAFDTAERELAERAGRRGDDAVPPRLALREGRRKIALEERDYAVRDRGARPLLLARDPSYDLVRLVTRFPERFAGFQVRTVSRRVPLALDEQPEPRPIAEMLVGDVRAPFLLDVLEHAEHRAQIVELSTRLERSADENRILEELVGKSLRAGELLGGTGIEGYFDALLAGRNGYRETQGLEERGRSGRPAYYQPPIDGLDLELTLDLELQRAAEDVIERPDPPPASEPRPDPEWTRHPVGAIVLLTPEGDVLAAASAPTRPGEPGAHQDGQRAFVMDRTLRLPCHQTPGSVLKPFVAAWALQRLGLPADRGLVVCTPELGEELPRWGHVHCHSQHSVLFAPIDLRTALRRSCNAYFSYVGDKYFDGEEFRRMATACGFGQPTGVRSLPPERANAGLREDWRQAEPIWNPEGVFHDVQRQRVANGLTHITATPMQVARAYAALATGRLPELRLVRGHEHLQRPRVSTPLDLERRTLDLVRAAMVDVVASPDGSAHGKGLDAETLGFQVALKTGSADYRRGQVPSDEIPGTWESGMRKHTWVAGWAPASDPRLVFVVYVHDTSATSSRGAVYVAAQLLQSPAIRAYLDGGVAATTAGRPR